MILEDKEKEILEETLEHTKKLTNFREAMEELDLDETIPPYNFEDEY